jgi:type II secretory pathway pseudopilin PulG
MGTDGRASRIRGDTPRCRRAQDPDRAQGEAGESLVELLLTVLIIGIVFVAVIGALGTTIIASDLHRRQSSAEVLLVDALESVKRQAYVPCSSAGTGSYDATAGVTVPDGWTVAVTSVHGWNGVSAWVACPADDHGLERVTITVTSPGGATTNQADVVKRG